MHSIITLIAHFVSFFLLATWTYGLYVPSGLFVPVILCGAAMGRLFGECIYLAFPNGTWSSPGTYALIGAASLLGNNIFSNNLQCNHELKEFLIND